jgi:hypothetical protein
MQRALVVWLFLAVISLPTFYKQGRLDMYADVCAALGVNERIHLRVNNSVIRPDGILTFEKSPVPKDVCNNCHFGGI